MACWSWYHYRSVLLRCQGLAVHGGKEQIVVMLSCLHMAKDNIIVGNMNFAVSRMWDLIIGSSQ